MAIYVILTTLQTLTMAALTVDELGKEPGYQYGW